MDKTIGWVPGTLTPPRGELVLGIYVIAGVVDAWEILYYDHGADEWVSGECTLATPDYWISAPYGAKFEAEE